jgi:RHS repeat-associated protein
VYDGWNVAAILDGSNNPLYTFTWGTDLSGSMQGAGGVGGLISMTVCTGANAGTYFPCYDGNGNVVAMVNAATGAIAANFEYGPFGELIRATGPMAKLNPFMFSTKYYDWETGLYYYGYRYYNPSTGRWLSRDPIGESGGMNLYCLMGNDPIGRIDINGLADRWILNWHHNASQAIFEGVNGNPSYISTKGISLAQGVNIHTKERGMMLRAGDHTYKAEVGTVWEENGIHLQGFDEAMKRWVDSLPEGTVITDQMLDNAISQIYSMPEFSGFLAKGSIPRFNTYQEYQARFKDAEAGAEAEATIAQKGAVECAGYAIFMFQVGSTISDLQRAVAGANNADPWVGIDTAGDLFSIGQDKENDWSFLGYNHYKVTGYFVVSMTGPHKGMGFAIPKEIYKELEKQFKEVGNTRGSQISG